MSKAYSKASYLKRQSVAIQYTLILVVLLATFYVVTIAGVWSDDSTSMSKSSETNAGETTIEAPNEALLRSQKAIRTSAGSSVSTNVQAVQSTVVDEAGSPSVDTTVKVNGKQLKIGNNSSVRKVIKSDDQTTTVDVSTQSNSNSTSNSHTSLDISVESTSEMGDKN